MTTVNRPLYRHTGETMQVEDFPRQYRWSMVRAYSVISGVPNAFAATHAEIDAGFARVLENRNLRRTHEMYLAEHRNQPTYLR